MWLINLWLLRLWHRVVDWYQLISNVSSLRWLKKSFIFCYLLIPLSFQLAQIHRLHLQNILNPFLLITPSVARRPSRCLCQRGLVNASARQPTIANFPILKATSLFSRSLETLNNPFHTSAMKADLWISKVSERGYDSRYIQCQANGQTKSPRIFIDLCGLIDDLGICDGVEAHDKVYIIALINRSFKPTSTLFSRDRLLEPLCGIL